MSLGGTIRKGCSNPGQAIQFVWKRSIRHITKAWPQLYGWYKVALLRYVHGFRSPPRPYKLVSVDPTAIEKITERSCPYWEHEHTCEIEGGPWDRNVRPLETEVKYRSLKNRFEDGFDWEDTDLYQKLRTELESHEEVLDHLSRYDLLYRDLDTRYRTSFELPDAEFLEEICVSIGRDGEILSCDSGLHRLAIAQALELDEVPVRVMYRHEEWQRKRDRFSENWNHRESLPTPLEEYVDHPDMADLRETTVTGRRG